MANDLVMQKGLPANLEAERYVLGAILLTGYMGGAVSVHVHMKELGMTISPVIFGMLLWLGLVLRDEKVRAVLPIRCNQCCRK